MSKVLTPQDYIITNTTLHCEACFNQRASYELPNIEWNFTTHHLVRVLCKDCYSMLEKGELEMSNRKLTCKQCGTVLEICNEDICDTEKSTANKVLVDKDALEKVINHYFEIEKKNYEEAPFVSVIGHIFCSLLKLRTEINQ